MVKYLKMLLWPFSLVYGGVMQVRNALYDTGTLASARFQVPVIAVGNLTVGGTGKTPHVEYLLRLLHKYKIATLSRGYKRKTKGFLLADGEATAERLGDEPYQYHRDFPEVTVAVAEDRVLGLQRLQQAVPDLQVIVLDDAMQHRPVHPSLNLLITEYGRPFYHDLVLPAGMLREPRSGAARADAIIVSKCPEMLPLQRQHEIKAAIRMYSRKKAPVFFSTFTYGQPVPLGQAARLANKLVLLTGIANPVTLVRYLQKQGYTILHHAAYPDHHSYTLQDMHKMKEMLQKDLFRGASVLTTRKDAVKLAGEALQELTHTLPLFYIPVEVTFIDEKDKFDKLILQHVRQFVS
ncbi:tetraacyldisaccharide 4'-kinase [Pontibacter liquoris]|uniref:tetraacyldisaccharide 4'-kinase n=1 Tax=Pontibacter liquoris TaxID=2905677 RepID=UPI001FA803E2|nr:tetraacyldisaccharide 4'-kinase [Pontibacter liquoris]